MELEARSFSADRARPLLAKAAQYRADAKALRTRAAAASARGPGADATRAELGLGGGAAGPLGGDRDRVLGAQETLTCTGDRIAQGRAMLAETEVRMDWRKGCVVGGGDRSLPAGEGEGWGALFGPP